MPVFLDWTHRINGHTIHIAKQNIHLKNYSMPVFLDWIYKVFYPCLLKMDTPDKQSNKIFIQSILPMSFYNGHTGQTVKQHIHSKDSTHVFLEWTHRTNGQTTYQIKDFFPYLFIKDTHDKRTNRQTAYLFKIECFE